VESVLHSQEGLVVEAEERSLLQLHAVILASVDVLHPAMVSGRSRRVDMLLKHDDVRIGDLLGVGGGDDGSCPIMDGVYYHR